MGELSLRESKLVEAKLYLDQIKLCRWKIEENIKYLNKLSGELGLKIDYDHCIIIE